MQERLREEGPGLLEFLLGAEELELQAVEEERQQQQLRKEQERTPLELEEPQDTPVRVPQDMSVVPVPLEIGLGTVPVRRESGQEAVEGRGELDQGQGGHRQELEHQDWEAWPPQLPQLPPPQLLPPSSVGAEGNKSAPASSAPLRAHLRPQFQL